MAAGSDAPGTVARLAATPMFASLPPVALVALANAAERLVVPGGATLIEEGAIGHGVHLLVAGALVAERRETGEAAPRRLGAVMPGETVGELGLISGRPAMASVSAARDSELLFLPKAAFEAALGAHPASLWALAGLLAERQRRAGETSAPPPPRTLTLAPADPEVDGRVLAAAMVEACRTLGLKAITVDEGDAGRPPETFARLEAAHDLLIYLAEARASDWTAFALRQADRVVIVASGPPTANATVPGGARPADLWLIGAKAGEGAVAAWGRARPIAAHLNLAGGGAADLARALRHALGRSVGLVVSGGGARGFAHLGVLRALDAAGVAIDRIAGVSMGAVVAAGHALGWSHDEARANFHANFIAVNPTRDYTWPVLALTRGDRVSRMLRAALGDVDITDLPRPFFTLSADLTASAQRVHRDGPLWRAVRASLAIPGLLPPVSDGGAVLVDGGVINNLPVDVMAAEGRGPVIGVDVGGARTLACDEAELDGPGLRWLARRLRGRGAGFPGIASTLVRAGTISSEVQRRQYDRVADLLLRPPLADVPILDWRSFDRAVEIGYRYASERLEALDEHERRRLGVA